MRAVVRFDLTDPDARVYCAECGAAFAREPDRCPGCGSASFVGREEAERAVAALEEEARGLAARAASGAGEQASGEAEEPVGFRPAAARPSSGVAVAEPLAFLVAVGPREQLRVERALDRAGIPWECEDPEPAGFLVPEDLRAPSILVPAGRLEEAQEVLAALDAEPSRPAPPDPSAPAPDPDDVPPPARSLEALRGRRLLWLSRGLLAWVTLSMLVASLQLAFTEGAQLPGRFAVACGLATLAGLVLDVFLPGRGAALSLLSYLAALVVLFPVAIGNWMAFIGLLAALNCWRITKRR